ncbi:hypothetical protein HFO86_34680 [Rhizobium leguminosarum]|uniref:hypothetical protein n=1 Tax=Rhizobium leguminosarum TaxID=384 RepID=UPI001C978BF1|nr:hypothetical protein [Rhizobium leguminosarum]MBY5475292.1 hypothetical protein [Rhizobium leguminosarum]
MDWPSIRQAAAEYFGDNDVFAGGIGRLVRGIGPEEVLGLSTNSQALYLGPIDWTWGADDKQIDTKLKAVQTEYILRCNQVEILLQEAGVLIERALGDVLKYDDLNVERFKVMMEFVEYDRTYSQQLLEQRDGDYWNGLAKEADLAAEAKRHLSDNSEGKPPPPARAGALFLYAQAATFYGQAASNARAKGDLAGESNAAAAQATTSANLLQYRAQLAANSSESDSQIAREKYETQARIHQIERQYITQELIGIKLNELRRPGGALNYNDRMREVGERALNDFLEVTARVYAIALGLCEFCSVTDPSESDLDRDIRTARTRVEGAVTWLRKAANAIARARIDEQACVVRITLKPKSGGKLLDELKKGRIVPFSEDLVTNLTRAQLRGISASAEGLTGDSWIDLEAASPQQKLVHAKITLPSVTARLGRVSTSASLNVRDIGGGRPIVNRSPVGNWTVRVVRDDAQQPLQAVHLDFHLAFY